MEVGERKNNVGELQHKEEEEEASQNVGNGPQEREDSNRIKSVATTCRSWRCPPVLEMVALRGLLSLSAPWALDGSRVAAHEVLLAP